MSILLNLCYLLVLVALSPAILWISWRKGKYREGFAEKILGKLPAMNGDQPCVWFHAVSVGEVNLLATTIDRFETECPLVRCLITTTTKTGHDLARSKYSKHTVAYCPLDFSWAVRNAIQRVRPSLLVIVELEIWPNLINAAERADVPIALINGRLSERSFSGYQRIRFLICRVLQKFSLIAVQTDEYADRFIQLGADPESVVVTGSVKFDGALTDRRNAKTQALERLIDWSPASRIFLAGSTMAGEEQLAINTFKALADDFPELKLVLVPRHPERFDDVARLLEQQDLVWQRRTSLGERLNSDVRAILVDTVGELGAWWGMADVAFVGGSMSPDRGGQNMIEPAAYGAAVCFGPHTANFRDVVQRLLNHDAASVVQDGDELTAFVRHALACRSAARQMGDRAQDLVVANQGATARTFESLIDLLSLHHLPMIPASSNRGESDSRRKSA